MYLDSKGLIVTETGDGGDTLQREGFWFEGRCLSNYAMLTHFYFQNMLGYTNALEILNTPQGWIRYPNSPYNSPSDTSRDQLVPNIRAMGYLGTFNYYLKDILKKIIKNFSRFPNGDLAFVNDYGRFIRAFEAWYLYPLLLICDIPLVVNAILICFWLAKAPSPWRIWLASKASWLYWLTNQYPPNAEGVPQSPYGSTNTSNDINFIGDLAQAQKVYPTPISFLARKIYEGNRPCGVQFALDSYFSAASGNNPEFAALWAPIVRDF